MLRELVDEEEELELPGAGMYIDVTLVTPPIVGKAVKAAPLEIAAARVAAAAETVVGSEELEPAGTTTAVTVVEPL
jgi:hypothetical protein